MTKLETPAMVALLVALGLFLILRSTPYGVFVFILMIACAVLVVGLALSRVIRA